MASLGSVEICPKCYSDKIKKDWNLMGTRYKCEKCGYKGVLILEMSQESLKKFKKKDLNNRRKSKSKR